MTVADPLTDEALSEPRRPFEHDPMAGHRAFLERVGQEQWRREAIARAYERPIEEVLADLERRELEQARGLARDRVRKPQDRQPAKKAPAKKAQPPAQRRSPAIEDEG